VRAIVQQEYGSTDVLELQETARPEPGDGEVLVRVDAAGVDRGAWHLMTGRPYVVRAAGFGLRRPKTQIPGSGFAGVVEATGPGVADITPGDAVYGSSRGTFAEFVVAPADRVAPKPGALTFAEAAVLPYAGSVALQALRDQARVEPGTHVLVIGASGAVGSVAVQLAKAFGAEVTGVCSARNADLVRDLGADHTIDYARSPIGEWPGRYDVVLDIAGNNRLAALRRLLRDDGTLVIVGGENGDPLTGGTHRQLAARLLSPLVRPSLRAFIAKERASDFAILNALVDEGSLRPVVAERYPLAEAADAVRRLESGRPRGRIVLEVASGPSGPATASPRPPRRSAGG
jgi:NADPH:quinone reductase-like Zn-dependent oxidoreductase